MSGEPSTTAGGALAAQAAFYAQLLKDLKDLKEPAQQPRQHQLSDAQIKMLPTFNGRGTTPIGQYLSTLKRHFTRFRLHAWNHVPTAAAQLREEALTKWLAYEANNFPQDDVEQEQATWEDFSTAMHEMFPPHAANRAWTTQTLLDRYKQRPKGTWNTKLRVRSHSTTGFTPFRLLYGVDPQLPHDASPPVVFPDDNAWAAHEMRAQELERQGRELDAAKEHLVHRRAEVLPCGLLLFNVVLWKLVGLVSKPLWQQCILPFLRTGWRH